MELFKTQKLPSLQSYANLHTAYFSTEQKMIVV